MEEPIVRNWFDYKRDGSMLLRVSILNKAAAKIKVFLKIEHDCAEGQTPNVLVPESELVDILYRGGDSKVAVHLQKIK